MLFRLITGVTALVLAVVVALFLTVEPLRWRATVLMRFIDGEITDASLGELLSMLRPRGGFWLQPLLKGKSLSAVVESPFYSKEDVEAGGRIFHLQCAPCHGADAGGASAPPLRRRATLTHGSSDWALYRNVRNGIPGTVMPPVGLSINNTWRVVSFIKSLQTKDAPTLGADVPPNGAKNAFAGFRGLTYRSLLEADRDVGDWRMYSRTYEGWRFSPLTQINPRNVGELRLRWIRQSAALEMKIEATPIVADGVMFITEPPNSVLAVDARNGHVLWSYQREIIGRLSVCCGKVNRGVAVLNEMVYVGTLDAHLVALEARTGRVIWDTEVAKAKDGYSITGAPLAVQDMVLTGVSGGEFGIRGFLQAVDAQTGQTRWRFYTVPGPGEIGHDSWSGRSWETGGGPTWITGSFDAKLNLIYWGVGNPSPVHEAEGRRGDNLYTNSVIAIDATTGRLVWHFQFTPHDAHDWDSTQVPVLASIKLDGAQVPVIAWANRNGFYYVLDRRDGRFVTGTPFVHQNWAKGLDGSGRPVLTSAGEVSPGGTFTYPSVAGGTSWQSPAFDPKLGLFFVHAVEGASVFTRAGKADVKRRPFEQFLGSGSISQGDVESFVRALKVETGERVWQYQSSRGGVRGWWSGLLATAGGLVFGGSGERVFALNAATGDEVWSVRAGGQMYPGPISYSIDGQQVVVFIAGRAVIAFSL